MSIAMLTTVDNPYDPKDQFDQWYQYDTDKGYNSCGLLDRIAMTSPAMSDQENAAEIERAIDEIVRFDPLNVYKKVVR